MNVLDVIKCEQTRHGHPGLKVYLKNIACAPKAAALLSKAREHWCPHVKDVETFWEKYHAWAKRCLKNWDEKDIFKGLIKVIFVLFTKN